MRFVQSCSKLLMVMIISFFMSIPISFAREMTVNDLEEELERKNINSEYIYIIGDYVFTGDYVDYDFPDIMMAANSIKVEDLNGKVKNDKIFKEMTIFYMTRNFNTSLLKYDKLVPEENIVGDTKLPDTLNIKYIDYDFLKELYKVTFNADNGEENKVVKVEDGSTVAIPDTPVKEGFYFDGWYIDDTKYEFNTPVKADITLTAKWLKVEDVYTKTEDLLSKLNPDYFEAEYTDDKITVNMTNGRLKLSEVTEPNVFVALTSLLSNEGVSKLTISYPDVEALELTGNTGLDIPANTVKITEWLTTNMDKIVTGKTYDDVEQRDLVGKQFTITIDLKDGYVTNSGKKTVTYTIDFTAVVKYNVTFNYNDDGVTEEQTVQILENSTIESIENPTREHYDFDGWYKDDTLFEVNTPIKEDITLTAHWKGKTYTATFVGEGIDASIYTAQTVTYPGVVSKPTPDPTRTGHTFTGWFVNDEQFNFDAPLTGNVEIKAVWDINKYSVKFYSDKSDLIEDKTVLHEATVTAPENANKKGYNLTWKKDSPEGTDYDLSTPVVDNLNLYAHYEPFKYTFKFVGDEIEEEDQALTYPAKPEKPETPVREGYTFLGWYLGDAEEEYNFDEEILTEGDIVLTGKWEANVYHVKYECDGCNGSMPLEQDYTYPDKPAKPTLTPTKIGYDFKYWYDQDVKEETEYNFEGSLVKDLTLVAKFEPKKLNVNFVGCSDTDKECNEEDIKKLPEKQVVDYGNMASEPETEPEREGYDFMGWYLRRGSVVNQAPFEFNSTRIINDITLVAKWQKKTYTVTFKLDEEVLDTINGVEHGTTVQEAIAKAKPNLSPYKESHRFSHWYLDGESDSNKYELTTPVTANITLKAKMIPLVDIDNIVSDMALKVDTESFVASYLNKTITIDVSKGDDEHSAAHNDDSIKNLVESGNTGIAKAIKEVVANENVLSVKMSYDGSDYEFTNDETAIKGKLKDLLTAIAIKNSSTYETATLNELIENNYSDNPLTLTITLKGTAETVEGQRSPATYNVKVASSIITVTNESELKNALLGNYESIKIGNNFNVNAPVMINRSVSIFGADHNTTITLDKPEADTVLDIRHSGIGGAKTDVNIKDLTIQGTKKGINVPEASTSLSLMNVHFKGNSEMAMFIAGKVHTDGDLSYDKEDYDHPFIRTKRSNAITGGLASSSKTTGNIEVHSGYAAYDYKIIVPFGGDKYEDGDFKEHTWKTNGWEIGEKYCEKYDDGHGGLKEEYSELIGKDNVNTSDQLQGTDWAHYYLQEKNSKYYTIIFRDTPSAALTIRYVLYGGNPVEPGEPFVWQPFQSYAKFRTLGKDEGQKTYELKGWSNDDKGKSKDYDLDIKNVTEIKNYYTYYEEIKD